MATESKNHTTEVDEFFADSPRVVYATSPLVEVVCQISFPTILRIEAQLPADFQEDIRSKFPTFSRQRIANFEQLPREIAEMMAAAGSQPTNYIFQSEDQKRTITLSPSSLAYTSRSYSRWEEFRDVIVEAKSSLEKHYNPSFYSRVGLRYQNAIQPAMVNLKEKDWNYFLSENVVGEFRKGTFGQNKITEAHRMIRIVSDKSNDGVLLQHGLGALNPDASSVYVIDIDCYTTEKVEVQNAEIVFARLNRRAGRAFRWCISDEYHEALGPTNLG